MVDTVLLKDGTPLLTQAQVHHTISDHISWMISTEKLHDDAFFSTTRASEMPEMSDHYAAWASPFNTHLKTHAVVHQDIGNLLTGTIDGFNRLDGPPSYGDIGAPPPSYGDPDGPPSYAPSYAPSA